MHRIQKTTRTFIHLVVKLRPRLVRLFCHLVGSVLLFLQRLGIPAAVGVTATTLLVIWSIWPVRIGGSAEATQAVNEGSIQAEMNQLVAAALREQDPARGLRSALRMALLAYRSMEDTKIEDSDLEITDSLQFAINSISPPVGRHQGGKQSYRLQAAAFSPLGNILATLETSSPEHEHGKLRVLNTDSIRTTDSRSLKRKIRARTLTTSSYGGSLALLDDNGVIWYYNKWKENRFIPLYNLDPGWIAVALSPNDKWLALGGWDASVSIWNMDSQTLAGVLTVGKGPVWDIAFNREGDVFATASADSTITLWDFKSGNEIRTLNGHAKDVRRIAFNPTGDIIASAGWDNTIKVWDVNSGKELFALVGHTRPVNSLAYNHNGSKMASGSSDGTVKVWDMKTTELVFTLRGHKRSVRDVAFSPDGGQIASAGTDKTVIIWDTHTGKKRLTLKGHQQTVWSVGFSHDGTRLVSASNDGSAIVWDPQTGKKKLTIGEKTASAVNEAIFTSTDKYIVTAGNSAVCRWWNKETGQEEFQLGGTGFSQIAMSPDGSKLAVLGRDNIISLIKTKKPITRILEIEGPKDGAAQIAFSPGGGLLAVAGNDGTVTLWETATGKAAATLERTAKALGAIAFSPEGYRMAVAATADNPKILNVDWSINKRLKGSQTGEESNDGQGILNVRLNEDAESGGEKLRIYSVALSPFGELVATAGADDRIRVWSARTGILILSIHLPKQKIRWLSFGPNGLYFLAVGDRGTIYYSTKNFYRRDAKAVMAMGFERLGKLLRPKVQSHLYNGIAMALCSDYKKAIAEFQKVPTNSPERTEANRLIRQLLSMKFTASDAAYLLQE